MRVREGRERRRRRRGRPAGKKVGARREARRRDVQALGGGAHDGGVRVRRHPGEHGRDARTPDLRAQMRKSWALEHETRRHLRQARRRENARARRRRGQRRFLLLRGRFSLTVLGLIASTRLGSPVARRRAFGGRPDVRHRHARERGDEARRLDVVEARGVGEDASRRGGALRGGQPRAESDLGARRGARDSRRRGDGDESGVAFARFVRLFAREAQRRARARHQPRQMTFVCFLFHLRRLFPFRSLFFRRPTTRSEKLRGFAQRVHSAHHLKHDRPVLLAQTARLGGEVQQSARRLDAFFAD